MNQQPTYEQLAQAYASLMRENEQLKANLTFLQTDKTLERVKTLTDVISTFTQLSKSDKSYNKIIKNAAWHLEQMLAKPKAK